MSKHSLLAATPQQCGEEDKQQRKHSISPIVSSNDVMKAYPSQNSTDSSRSGASSSGESTVTSSISSLSILPSEQKRAGNTGVIASSGSSSTQEKARLNSESFLEEPAFPDSDVRVKTVVAVQGIKVEGRLGGISNISNSGGVGSTGRWTAAEHEAFLGGLRVHGREWKKVARLIPTRTAAQIRSHAQKYFAKLARDARVQNAAVGSTLLCERGAGSDLAGAAVAGLAPLVPRQASEGEGSVTAGSSGAQEVPQGPGMGPMSLRSSVVERVSRIMQDPDSVQAEVEQTLQALRDRYSQLQKRLQQPRTAPPPARHTLVQPDRVQHGFQSNHIRNDAQINPQKTPPKATRKSTLFETSTTQSHDFFSKELIALSVLGRSLPCSVPTPTKHPCNTPSIVLLPDKPPPPRIQTSTDPHVPEAFSSPVTPNQHAPHSENHDDALLQEPRQKRQKTMAATATTLPFKEEENSQP
uniref:HTH myb-type domain-containing protein n=1 Tax=Ditylum brightwellii TaxID=49249 RepID=A0A7S4R1D4_9STRA|mmetsp:Transcript_3955/g.5342  ORF Transcript_3955/g.5342 Transcript_3955/m.5342 type:complete len:469 (+) Transcript_3955:59-1465(+)